MIDKNKPLPPVTIDGEPWQAFMECEWNSGHSGKEERREMATSDLAAILAALSVDEFFEVLRASSSAGSSMRFGIEAARGLRQAESRAAASDQKLSAALERAAMLERRVEHWHGAQIRDAKRWHETEAQLAAEKEAHVKTRQLFGSALLRLQELGEHSFDLDREPEPPSPEATCGGKRERHGFGVPGHDCPDCSRAPRPETGTQEGNHE